jgi:hypothetical protein
MLQNEAGKRATKIESDLACTQFMTLKEGKQQRKVKKNEKSGGATNSDNQKN